MSITQYIYLPMFLLIYLYIFKIVEIKLIQLNFDQKTCGHNLQSRGLKSRYKFELPFSAASFCASRSGISPSPCSSKKFLKHLLASSMSLPDGDRITLLSARSFCQNLISSSEKDSLSIGRLSSPLQGDMLYWRVWVMS